MTEMIFKERELLPAPTKPGFYRYSGGGQVMIFLLRPTGQWKVMFNNGDCHDCHWAYIEQGLSVWNLVPIDNKGA